MKLFEKIKKLIDFSIVFIPGASLSHVHSKTLAANKAIVTGLLFLVSVALVVSVLWLFTPLKEFIPRANSGFSDTEFEIITNLNEKVNFLMNKIESLEKTNKKLNEVISNSDTVLQKDSNSIKKNNKKKLSGSVYQGFRDFIDYFVIDDKKIFRHPIVGYISKDFNPANGHFGVDYVVNSGTPIFAAANGFVIYSDYSINDGYVIIVGHSDDYITIYKHCSSTIKKSMEKVLQGEIIGFSGNTGKYSYGPHLHFEVWHKGRVIDPKNVLK